MFVHKIRMKMRIMKKVYIFLSGMFLFGQLLSGQTQFHWGSTGDP